MEALNTSLTFALRTPINQTLVYSIAHDHFSLPNVYTPQSTSFNGPPPLVGPLSRVIMKYF